MIRKLFFLCVAMTLIVAFSSSMLPARAASPTGPNPVPKGSPRYVSIPKLHVRASVESVGMTRVSDADAPYHWGDVAWYSHGARPGEMGHAPIFGHLDSTCCPAVFYHLKALRPGDLTYVSYRNGRSLAFRVVWSRNYANQRLPYRFIFGPSHERGIVLITCSGAFHPGHGGYDHKLLVYAKLVGPRPG